MKIISIFAIIMFSIFSQLPLNLAHASQKPNQAREQLVRSMKNQLRILVSKVITDLSGDRKKVFVCMDVSRIKQIARSLERSNTYSDLQEAHHQDLYNYCLKGYQKQGVQARNRLKVKFQMIHLKNRLTRQDLKKNKL